MMFKKAAPWLRQGVGEPDKQAEASASSESIQAHQDNVPSGSQDSCKSTTAAMHGFLFVLWLLCVSVLKFKLNFGALVEIMDLVSLPPFGVEFWTEQTEPEVRTWAAASAKLWSNGSAHGYHCFSTFKYFVVGASWTSVTWVWFYVASFLQNKNIKLYLWMNTLWFASSEFTNQLGKPIGWS